MGKNYICYGCGIKEFRNFIGIGETKLYSCSAPHCKSQTYLFCEQCVKKLGGKIETHSGCPHCGLGRMNEKK